MTKQIGGMNHDYLNRVLEMDEGNVLKLYKDSLGYYTIGIGHLLTKKNDMVEAIRILDKDIGRSTGGNITKEESYKLLQSDIERILKGIENSKIIKPVWDTLSPIRKIGLFSMCFQMGIQGVEGFRNSLRFIQNGQWDIAEMNLKKSLWYRQTRNRATRVINIITKEDLIPYNIFIS